ncbi:succinate semialdehyde dehydrogenase NADP+ linked [Lithohypha guttulata]|uniref:Succinate-semialdehyde dehydrogenase n=1 Tax=Lithohypha guttulata TaxID=1690604 RepID=A0AAN7YJJ2_9EURO|nr:succinate semialdehyde dehydrogenase NADP+ linked [Lithohypha guttulata]KAK5090453.1 succinate semialdehyde dehydrogenase NADP+ linked [Lithohypha guttulata]KAK5104753.1 succinate semialdehyde dehydrogenase NADP+ linked [Lithohypha guttulata]
MGHHEVPKLNDPSLLISKAYVNGEFVDAASGETFEAHDPSTGKKISTCPEFNKQDTEKAIAAAEEALKSWRKTTGRERATYLRKWYDEMQKNAADIATLITWENGKPLTDAKGETQYAANFFLWFSEEAAHIHGDTVPASIPGNRVYTIRQPVGVCGLITPWNFPAAMITRKIGPALAGGNTVVAKSPGETPFTANALAELSRRAGIPKGVVNFVTALKNTPEVGEALTTDPRIKKVSFTGSTNVGKLLMKQAAGTMKKVSWELGGNAPFIVFDDCADLDAAVAGAIACKFRSSGQTCVCANRIYVQDGIYDKFADKFAEKVKNFKVGYGFDDGVTHGPVIHDRAVGKVEAHVQDAEKKGGKVLTGGKRMTELGDNFFQPTVIRDATMDMQIAQEETFGPIGALFRFKTEKEVVALANDTPVGLAGYFYSSNVNRIYRVAEALEVGMIGVNTGLISDAAAPFGGVKESGFGREGSRYGIEEYTIIKSVTIGGIESELQG